MLRPQRNPPWNFRNRGSARNKALTLRLGMLEALAPVALSDRLLRFPSVNLITTQPFKVQPNFQTHLFKVGKDQLTGS